MESAIRNVEPDPMCVLRTSTVESIIYILVTKNSSVIQKRAWMMVAFHMNMTRDSGTAISTVHTL